MDWSNTMAALIATQQDMHEMVSRFKSMVDSTPADVTFEFFDNSMFTVPNFAKMGYNKTFAYQEITSATTELVWQYGKSVEDPVKVAQIQSNFPIESTYPLNAINGQNENGYLNGIVIPHYTARWYRCSAAGIPSYTPIAELGDFTAKSASARFVTTGVFNVSSGVLYKENKPEEIRAVAATEQSLPDRLINYDHLLSVMSEYSQKTKTWAIDFNLKVRFNRAAIEHCKEDYPAEAKNVLSIKEKHIQDDIVVDGIAPYKFYKCIAGTGGTALCGGKGMWNYLSCPSSQPNQWALWEGNLRDTHHLEISLIGFEMLLPFRENCSQLQSPKSDAYSPPFEGFGRLTTGARSSSPVMSLRDGRIIGKATMLSNERSSEIQEYKRILDTAAVNVALDDHFHYCSVIKVDLVEPLPVCVYEPGKEHATELADPIFDVACRGLSCPAGKGVVQKFGYMLGAS